MTLEVRGGARGQDKAPGREEAAPTIWTHPIVPETKSEAAAMASLFTGCSGGAALAGTGSSDSHLLNPCFAPGGEGRRLTALHFHYRNSGPDMVSL